MTETQVDKSTITARLQDVEERIRRACDRAGRERDEITVVAVTKVFPLEVARAARAVGLRDLAEARGRELRDKAREMPGETEGGEGVRWHMVGHCQTNKAKFVARHADVFHALDSDRLADELDKRARKNERTLPCFVQVNTSGEESKYGLEPSETHDFLDRMVERDHLRVPGLMMLASFADDPETVRPEFERLRELQASYADEKHPTVDLQDLSMGMSNDFEVALEEGATHLRLGTALFGPRPT
jgi:pyridoxal phosphate enzyme (YggS family)